MILVSLKDGKTITLDASQTLTSSLSNQESISDNSLSVSTSDDDDDDDEISTGNLESSQQPKQKRQRLTHLSFEEKLQRRKLKNRIAAQSARDRKKSKFDQMEESVRLLKEQNEQLRIENKLLKEKTQLLVQENRKLLEFKKLSFTSMKPETITTLIQQSPTAPTTTTTTTTTNVCLAKLDEESNTCLKRKLINTQEYGLVEVKSAEFNNFVSQPQKQFQTNIILKLISVLIVYTMSLIKQTALVAVTSSSSSEQPNSSQAYAQKLTKLKATLVKLVKLLKKFDKRNLLLNRITHLASQIEMASNGSPPSKASLILLMSLLMKVKKQ
jgi:hypothetical protein